MRFFINVLTTYFPDTDPPYDVYYRQILEQVSGDARRLGDPDHEIVRRGHTDELELRRV